MKRAEIVRIISAVQAYWPHWTPNEFVGEAFTRLLGDLDYEPVVAAIEAMTVEHGEFAPGVGQIRLRAVAMAEPAGDAPNVDEAWREVQAEVRRIGMTRGMRDFSTGGTIHSHWSHPAVERAVESIGWRELCLSENAVADRAHFAKFYEGAVTQARYTAALPPSVQDFLVGHSLDAVLAEQPALPASAEDEIATITRMRAPHGDAAEPSR